jgi:hypothetical protein
MAKPDDSAFGAGFNPDVFRQAITSVMQMGKPPETARQATFVFASASRTYVTKSGATLTTPPRLDRDGRPFDPTIKVVEVPGNEKQVDCAIEISRDSTAQEGPIGTFRRTIATVTLLDEQYALVKGCRELRFNGDRYVYGYEPDET